MYGIVPTHFFTHGVTETISGAAWVSYDDIIDRMDQLAWLQIAIENRKLKAFRF